MLYKNIFTKLLPIRPRFYFLEAYILIFRKCTFRIARDISGTFKNEYLNIMQLYISKMGTSISTKTMTLNFQ